MKYLFFLFVAGALLIAPKIGLSITETDGGVIFLYGLPINLSGLSIETIQDTSFCEYIEYADADYCFRERTFLIELHCDVEERKIDRALSSLLVNQGAFFLINLHSQNPGISFYKEADDWYLSGNQFLLFSWMSLERIKSGITSVN